MFRRLRRALITLLEDQPNESQEKEKSQLGIPIGNAIASRYADTTFDHSSVSFKITKAKGGYVINANRYDVVADRQHSNTYVITDDCDLGTEINKILTMESLYLS